MQNLYITYLITKLYTITFNMSNIYVHFRINIFDIKRSRINLEFYLQEDIIGRDHAIYTLYDIVFMIMFSTPLKIESVKKIILINIYISYN